MASRAVQVSLDEALLEEIDADEEARRDGRSAFIRAAVRLYLRAKRKRLIDAQLEHAYSGAAADQHLDDISNLIDSQEWPSS